MKEQEQHISSYPAEVAETAGELGKHNRHCHLPSVASCDFMYSGSTSAGRQAFAGDNDSLQVDLTNGTTAHMLVASLSQVHF